MASVVSINQFRTDIDRLFEHILKDNKPLEIEYKGKKLIISLAEPEDKLAKLKPHPDCIKGDPEDIVHMDWSSEWHNDLS
ncbi:hypothetical protein QUF70_13755 [Desulfobacterales bacterium HSG17]|nr:hypothetical protein [Desulfobacterales bacterium HSG17]